MTSIELRRHDAELLQRVRYTKRTWRPIAACKRAGATSSHTACRPIELGLIGTPLVWWYLRRGVLKRRQSGRVWLDESRLARLRAGAHLRVVAYIAIAGLFSGAALAAATAGF